MDQQKKVREIMMKVNKSIKSELVPQRLSCISEIIPSNTKVDDVHNDVQSIGVGSFYAVSPMKPASKHSIGVGSFNAVSPMQSL
jgi:hypothetical protein